MGQIIGDDDFEMDVDPAQRGPPSPIESDVVPHLRLKLNSLVQQVRLFMRDYPELNRLIKGVEHSNRQIVWAIADCLDDFNHATPPFTNYGLNDFPSTWLLIRGVVISLLESVGLLQTRNHITFSDGGLQVGVNDKTPYIQSWLEYFRNSYEAKKQRVKVAANIEGAWGGGVHSEYRFINNFYGDW